MARVLRDEYGNPSSTHAFGRAARRRVDTAREQVAALIGAAPGEIVFTGSATEANNTAIFGAARTRDVAHVVTTATEHPSVSEPLAWLEKHGTRVTRVAVDGAGRVDPDAVVEAVGPDTVLVSVLLANNETGVIQDVEAIRERLAPGPLLHVDATQAVGKIPVDLDALGADLLSASAHKFNGPKGTGFLVQRRAQVGPLVLGGPQERRRRGGTENVAGIAGLGLASEFATRELADRTVQLARLRDRLWAGLLAALPDARRNGAPEHVLPNTLNVEFPGLAGEVLLEALDGEGVAVSAGAACASGSIEPSGVLLAMGRTPEQARASLRLSIGHGNDEAQIDRVIDLLPALVRRVGRIRT
jgi:cysteine desulfurase